MPGPWALGRDRWREGRREGLAVSPCSHNDLQCVMILHSRIGAHNPQLRHTHLDAICDCTSPIRALSLRSSS